MGLQRSHTTAQGSQLGNTRVRGFRLQVAGDSEAGQVRQVNQDSYLLQYLSDRTLLAVVADGMGGHRHGEYASRRATEIMQAQLRGQRTISPLLLAQAVYHANADVFQTAETNTEAKGMGTTLTAVLIQGDDCLIAHVGDSRLYHLRDENLQQLSHDHSWVAERVRQGVLSEDEAKHHRWRNVITNAIGASGDIYLDLAHLTLEAGDQLLLCSDGISSLLTENGMKQIMREKAPVQAVQELLEAADEAGSPDNVTAIVIRVDQVSSHKRSYRIAAQTPQTPNAPPARSSDEPSPNNHASLLGSSQPPGVIRIPLHDLSRLQDEVARHYPSNLPRWQEYLRTHPWYRHWQAYRLWLLVGLLAMGLYLIVIAQP